MENSKICFKCGSELPLSDFYKHKKMSDGHLNKCKQCTKRDSSERYQTMRSDVGFVQKQRKRGRDKYHRLQYKEKSVSKLSRAFRERYPEKYEAHIATQRMEPSVLGNHLHHWSYRSEHKKSVIEMSPREHAKAHRFLVYDQERMMYRTTSGLLLDTKERHEEYIQMVIRNEAD